MSSERYVALFDILGFKTIVGNNLLDRVVQIFGEFLKDAEGYQIFATVLGPESRQLISFKVFSDTIFVYSHDDSIEAFQRLVKFCQFLVGNSFNKGLLLRGAITKGEVVIRDDIFIGKPIVRAYQMEQEQDWVGCWIDDVCVSDEKPKYRSLIWDYAFIQYDIPLKSGVVEQHWALNWVWAVALPTKKKEIDSEINRRFTILSQQTGMTWDVKRKIANTKMFIEYAYHRMNPEERKSLKLINSKY